MDIVRSFLFSDEWDINDYDSLDLSMFLSFEQSLYRVFYDIKKEGKEISAYEVLKRSNKKMCIFYMQTVNSLDMKNFKIKNVK